MINYKGYTICYHKPNHYKVSRLGKQEWTADTLEEAKRDIDEVENETETTKGVA